jgi:transketolase
MQSLRKLVLEVANVSKEGHIPSSLSVLDILFVAYSDFIELEDDNRDEIKGNRFILSKGHASLGLYVVMNHVGLISQDDLFSFAKFDSPLGGHPDRNKISKIELSTGSLGHGFPQSVGMCKALKIKKKPGHLYVLIGDGECNEGSIWEAALFANHYKLNNLVVLIDYNKLQSLTSVNKTIKLEPLKSKWISFGWKVLQANGHDLRSIKKNIFAATVSRIKPVIIICHTTKGKGASLMENKILWHYRTPSINEQKIIKEQIINY